MKPAIVIAIRSFQGLLALGTLGMAAVVADWYINQSPFASPMTVNFLLFVPIFSVISIVYLEAVPRLAPRASHPFVSLAFELLNTIFYFAGFVAMAAFIARLDFCRGVICAAAKAATVAGAGSFALWAGTSTLMIKDVFKGGMRRTGGGGPAMTER
ncbi:uncharacterized protein DNG_06503 [Cephalotrichum gorgonifer]|uniref:MARVEL domain-containing protein n=1 Tax=Cephalotrichum gorgonifer TaxID=2041049 RepID=A0AAE8N2V3_9PEZI|nr:uncharacterized protein DNG_06503 [Cephalotrichum gorgonifer]